MKNAGEPNAPRNIPPFSALRAFEAVFRVGGIRRAAAILNLNHAVVSRHIRQLEEWLGESVIKRVGNQLLLTEIGARYHSRVSAAIADLELATEELKGIKDDRALRLTCVPGLATQWLAAQLSEFADEFPKFPVELRPAEIGANLFLDEADIDIRFYIDGRPPGPGGKGLNFTELARPEIMAVASPQRAKQISSLERASDLLTCHLLHEDNQNEWRVWLERNGIKSPKTLPGTLHWHAHLTIAAAKRGLGVALASPFLVKSDIERGELVEITLPGVDRVVFGCYAFSARTARWSDPAIVALRRFLKLKAQQMRAPARATRARP